MNYLGAHISAEQSLPHDSYPINLGQPEAERLAWLRRQQASR